MINYFLLFVCICLYSTIGIEFKFYCSFIYKIMTYFLGQLVTLLILDYNISTCLLQPYNIRLHRKLYMYPFYFSINNFECKLIKRPQALPYSPHAPTP